MHRMCDTANRSRTLAVEEGTGPLVGRLPEVAELYRRTFNGVPGIEPQWTLDRATGFLRQRVQEIGLVSALLFDGNRLVGVFVGVLVPKADGLWIADIDVLLDGDYRRNGLGRGLYFLGHLCAARTALAR